MTELGKIEKPDVSAFKEGRKLYLVPLISPVNEPPAFKKKEEERSPEDKEELELCSQYRERFNKYWDEAWNQINNLEAKIGEIRKIYYEQVLDEGEKGIKLIEETNEKSYQIIKSKLEKGAKLQATEKSQILNEIADCESCLLLGLRSQKVREFIFKAYEEAIKERNSCISDQIDKTLEDNEAGALFIREGHQVQFPSGIHVFYVAPPALDEIHRWLRDQTISKTT